MFEINDYNYILPARLIARLPAEKRDHSRLLLVDRQDRKCSGHNFFELLSLLEPGDLLIFNDTKVVKARLHGKKESGGQIEILVLDHPSFISDASQSRLCLMKSSKKPREGHLLFFENGLSGQIEEVLPEGKVRIAFKNANIDEQLDIQGQVPLPPYIKRTKDSDLKHLDSKRYQTIFSSVKGAIAAPTAGLHFTQELFKKLNKTGVNTAFLTLHVGYGTFSPVRVRDIKKHHLEEEYYDIPTATAEAINETKKDGGRVIAVGTTVVRTLEKVADKDGFISAGGGKTGLLITPGYSFKVVDALITNFHLPKSSLLFLVAAFAGLSLAKKAYSIAVADAYRFYSYGDAMLIV